MNACDSKVGGEGDFNRPALLAIDDNVVVAAVEKASAALLIGADAVAVDHEPLKDRFGRRNPKAKFEGNDVATRGVVAVKEKIFEELAGPVLKSAGAKPFSMNGPFIRELIDAAGKENISER